jgi:hypothetical protein
MTIKIKYQLGTVVVVRTFQKGDRAGITKFSAMIDRIMDKIRMGEPW